MKILQLGKFYPIRGGVEKVMWDLTRGLSAKGVACDMLCACLRKDMPVATGEEALAGAADGSVVQESEYAVSPGDFGSQVISFNGLGRCICVPADSKKAATMISPAMVGWLRRHASEYDLIHVHHPDPMACLALRLSGYKGRVFVHWHSDILKQKMLLRLYAPLQNWLVRRAERIIGTTPVYVAQSPWLQKHQGKVCYLPIGIEDRTRITPAPQTEPHFIFSLGRLVGYKGYRYLIEAAKWLPDDYRIEIGGSGPQKAELQALIDAEGLGGKVRLLGFVSDGDVRRKFNTCDLFALPSVMKTEAFGIVQIEAMSCSKPVIATTIPGSGTSWVNAHGESGLNVPPCDSRALADAIVAITSDRAVRDGFAERARSRFEQLFTLDAMVDGYLKML